MFVLLVASMLVACDTASEPLPTFFLTNTPLPPSETPRPVSQIQTVTPPAPTPEPSPAATLLPPCEEPSGQLKDSTYNSTIAGIPVPYRIYLPPCYESSGKSYPVLYIMHGLGDGMNDSQWDRMGLDEAADIGIERGALPPMVIVMPDGTSRHGLLWFGPTNSYEFMILDELLPHIEDNYCVSSSREGRAIGGLSRGAFWALEISLRHPEMFASVGGHSPFLFYDDAIPAENNPLDLANTATGIEDLRIYLDHGVNDYAVANIEVFSSRLTARGIEHTYIVNPVGFHNEEYWAAHTADYLSFYSALWSKDVNTLEDCSLN